MVNIDNEIFIREELNGITVYSINDDNYFFYKDIKIDELKGKTKKEVIKFLKDNEKLISFDIVFSYPFRLNWLIEKRCNLDCIYCYANNKMNNSNPKINVQETLKAINNLHVLNVGLTGGEPLLSPYLEEIITSLSNRCAIVIDTNGTLPVFEKVVHKLKKANVLIRMSIDTVDESINKKVRPCKNKEINTFKMIDHNIDILLENKVNLLIHTVVTTYNKDILDDVGEYLINKKIKKWHLYSVDYCEKCKDIYDNLKVNNDDMLKIYQYLKKKYQDVLEITLAIKSSNYSQCSIGMIDQNGRFFLDTIYDGIKYVGNNPHNPSIQEYKKYLNIEGHCKEYLRLK